LSRRPAAYALPMRVMQGRRLVELDVG
jgi:hypothetical protein